ncbi:hypothetical protein IMSAG049_00372 [Clostridiales bacterium]|nr:hypothetical protein IMSAG049_00372 [Clostridiales bacterium]
MGPFFKVAFAYYVAINTTLFVLMGVDKAKARKNKWRIKEATLMLTALLGGGIGGLLGMKAFHHKTKKWYFYVVYITTIVLHIAVIWWFKFRI